MLRPGDRVVAAVSGGADSVYLLHALIDLAPSFGADVVGVAHYNHGLRGAESDGDEAFVRELAERLGVAFFGERASAAFQGNLEQAARRSRYDFFERLAAEGACTRVATGHTRNDQAETLLFRLLRGTGPTGLAGVLPILNNRVIRPLLDVERSQIEDELRARGIGWRDDSSNADPRFSRNRIRHDLLPQLQRDWNPNVVEALAHLAALSADEEAYWDESIQGLVDDFAGEFHGGWEIGRSRIADASRAVGRRIVRCLVERVLGSLNRVEFEHVESILALAATRAGEGSVVLPGVRVLRSFDLLRFEPDDRLPTAEPVALRPGMVAAWPCHGNICLELVETTEVDDGCVTLKLEKPLSVRAWMPGDAYQRRGDRRATKLADLFEKERVPSWRRRLWPIVTDGESILWTKRFGVAEGLAPGPDERRALRVWIEEPAKQ